MKKVAIVGAGASGILCAILCAKNGLKVDLYEQNNKIAKKILASGNGRCNISNTTLRVDDYFSDNYGFVKDGLKIFGFEAFEVFVNSLGLVLEKKQDGRVYPLSNEAKSVVKIFEDSALNLGVSFHLDTKIQDIKSLTQKYDSVVIATGSQSASHLGGNDDGLIFAKEFGHSIITTYPSLVQLHLNCPFAKKMSGSKIDGEVTLFINGKKEMSISGDILFTNYGISGFAILDISQKASQSMMEYHNVSLALNLLPNYTMQKLSTYIIQTAIKVKNIDIFHILIGILPIKIVQNLLDYLKISYTQKEIHTKLAKKIANTILSWRFEVIETHGFRHSEVSGGGVNTLEINPKTMESLKQKNLYFCGEVLDIVGKRGGYNFAWAWASAYAAAKHINKKI